MKKEKADVFCIWTSAAEDYAGIMIIHSDPLPVQEAMELAYRLNKGASERYDHYRYVVQPA